VLRDEGFAFDVVDAVLGGQRGDDPYRARVAVDALARWVSRDDWPQLLAAYSRCVRILRTHPEPVNPRALVPERLCEPGSQALFTAYQQAAARVSPESSVDELLGALQTLVEPISTFFDQVLVMAEDKALRFNRLALLQSIAALAEGQIDLSRLQGF
jgi:glycyl-tRNA synthetase beta subunit